MLTRSVMRRTYRNTGNPLETLLARAVPDGDCLVWMGYRMRNGYGTASVAGKRWLVHRAVWTLRNGPIPDGLTIDHLCRNRACLNVEHMEVVTRGENAMRGGGLEVAQERYRQRTHCKKGHEYTPENSRVVKGRRICRLCGRVNWREWAVREGLRRPDPGRLPAKCGTRSGYRRHRARGEDCADCRAANAAYNRERNARAPKPKSTGPDRDVVEIILERARHACEICGKPVGRERGVDWSIHHRLPRRMGGSRWPGINLPSNLLLTCGSGTTGCHARVERYRSDAITNGWLVGQLDDPATVACLVDHGSRYVYLTDTGEYSDNPPSGDAA